MNELNQVKDYLQSLQSRIISELEDLDGRERFRRDAWQRPGGGGGLILDGDAGRRAAGGSSPPGTAAGGGRTRC